MKPLAILCLLCLPFMATPSAAQTDDDSSWEAFLMQVADDALASEADATDTHMAELTWLHEHPTDINTATKRQLLALPFLSERQADDILSYKALNGPFRSLAELRLIQSLDFRQRQWLALFLTAGTAFADSIATANVLHRRRSQLLTRLDIPCYRRAAYPWGRGIAHRWSYDATPVPHVALGLRGEKDAGEPIFTHQQPFYDAFGGYVEVTELGPVATAVVGDFRAGFGEGLVLGSGFNLGKQATGLWRNAGGLRPHRSADELRHLRGLGLTLTLAPHWSLTALASHRRADATLSADTAIATLLTTGLHRTASEQARRHNITTTTLALHTAFTHGPARAALTASTTRFSLPFARSAQLYRQIAPEGRAFSHLSASYGYRLSPLYFSGEVARSFASSNSGWATLHKAAVRPSSATQLALIHRFYSYHYFAPHASAFAEGATVQNESGLCLMVDADRVGPLALRAYFDYFYSPWPRYTMTRSSAGWEAMAQATLTPSRRTSLTLRYALKSKERSDRRHLSHQLRATIVHSPTAHLTATCHLLGHLYAEQALPTEPSHNDWGIALVPRLRYSPLTLPLRLDVQAALFSAPAYNARLFAYEPTVAETFGLSQYYGQGQRLAATAQWLIALRSASTQSALPSPSAARPLARRRPPQLLLQAKVGFTRYDDRDHISSGPLLIAASSRTDITILARLTW